MALAGKVLSVETRNLSEPTTAAASIGATTLYVEDASTFDELGGVVVVGGANLAYAATDAEGNSITLAAALTAAVAEQDLVEVYPPTPVKTALVDLGGEGDDPIPATVPHTLLDRLPDGTRIDNTAESVLVERRGTYEYVVTDMVAEPLIQQSLDYVSGEEGYGLADTGVQMQDAQVTGELGASVVSANQIILDGEDLLSTLAPIPKSTAYAVKGAIGNINAGTTNSTTELRMFTFDAGPVVAGRLYEVGCRGIGNGSVVGDVFWIRTRFTIDGSEPTLSSPTITGGLDPVDVKGGVRARINSMTFFRPAADGNLRIAISAQRLSGTGTLQIFTNGADFEFQTWCTDLGINVDSATALQQTAKVDGSGSDNPPETTKTLSWQAMRSECWSGMESDSGSAAWADGGDLSIGWNNDLPPTVNDRPGFAVLHFNHTDIVAKLASATSIIAVSLRFKVKWRESPYGLDMSVFAHKYGTFPHFLASNYAAEVTAARIVTGQGSRNDCAPGATYTIPLLTAVGTNLKSGLYKGLGITTTVYTDPGIGGIYSVPDAARPTLIITYRSPA